MTSNHMRNLQMIPALAVGAAAAFFAWYPISDGDIFWHLAAGREIVRTHSIPAIDPFSYTSQNLAWTDLHWLFQLFAYGLVSALGLKGILFANSLCFGLAAALLFCATGSRKTAWLVAAIWIAALFEVRYLSPHRPIMFSLLFLSLFIGFLELYRRKGKLRYLIFLLPVQVVWANVQPLFVLGPVIVAAWLAGDAASALLVKNEGRKEARQRIAPLACALSAVMVVSLINPWGSGAYKLALMLFGRTDPSQSNLFALTIAENMPLLWLPGTPGAQYVWATLAISVFAAVLIIAGPRRVRIPHLFSAAAMLFLAFRAERNIVLYFFAVLPLIGTQLEAVFDLLKNCRPVVRRPAAIAALAVPVLLAGFAAGAHAAMLKNISGAGSVAPFSFPDGSVEWLNTHPVPGAVFNADRHGGYLLWNLRPREKVFADTRYAIRPPAFLAEYCAILDDPALFESARKKYSITKTVLPAAFATRYFKLAGFLLASPEWRLVYADGTEALFVRSEAAGAGGLDLGSVATVDSLAGGIAQRWKSSPGLRSEGLAHFADFLLKMGKQEQSLRVRAMIGR